MALPTAPGERVTDGLIYRFIPNSPIYWEYDRGRPSPRAFRLRPGEKDGVSLYLDGYTSVERLIALEPTFGIYSVDVATLRTEARLAIAYWPDGLMPEGVAHVVVSGVNRRVAEWIARDVARELRAPAPAAGFALQDDDRPRDIWQMRDDV